MKASPGARSWIAAGVRHELFTRALPAVRHDMAAPVSIIRMGLLLLKRGSASSDEGSWEQRIGMIEEQVGAITSGVRALRHWELVSDAEGIARSALVKQCVGLMRAAFELNGIQLLVDESLAAREAEPVFGEAAALRYMVLGALGYLNDSAQALGSIRIEALNSSGIRFVAVRGTSETPDPMAGALRAPRTLAIDAVALQALADGMGFEIEVDGESVRLALSPEPEPEPEPEQNPEPEPESAPRRPASDRSRG
ncbi:conserved hypothetical protein [Burkholderiales bacterium 8X]|nr:conserved hypothetical protein [Burkholderiales bacterium 8X]